MGFGDESKKSKAAAKASAGAAADKAKAEAASWEENDKGLKAKSSRAAAKEEGADAKLAAKLEKKALEAAEEEENSKLSGAGKKGGASSGSSKLSQAEIARRKAMMAAMQPKAKSSAKTVTVAQPKLEENRNREVDVVEASGIDAALSALGVNDDKDKKGMTRKEWMDMMEPQVREENPGLKGSQVKDHLNKLWDRAPENPKNSGEK